MEELGVSVHLGLSCREWEAGLVLPEAGGCSTAGTDKTPSGEGQVAGRCLAALAPLGGRCPESCGENGGQRVPDVCNALG